MTSRPILFTGPMVRAILDGRKTQTRRVLKPMAGQQSKWLTAELLNGVPLVRMTETSTKGGQRDPGVQLTHPRGGPLGWIRSPYGGAGDRLWVRETFSQPGGTIHYRADDGPHAEVLVWKPSIFMRRHDSRITLEITDVRVERLNAISEADARSEGCVFDEWTYPQSFTPGRSSYRVLWESINGAGSWALNPWCWVISFRRL